MVVEDSKKIEKCPAPPPAPKARAVSKGGLKEDRKLDIRGMTKEARIVLSREEQDIGISFVTCPRGFDEDTKIRQRASILSWHMQPSLDKEVIIFGNDVGVKEFAEEWGMSHHEYVDKKSDVPLMDQLFRDTSKMAKYDVVCYINADITLPPEWWDVMQNVLPILVAQDKPFLVAGPRLVFPEKDVWHPTLKSWPEFRDAMVKPKLFSLPIIDGAIDWFVFRRGSYDKFPPFKLGRYVWDSFMVDFAVRSNWNTVTTFTWDRGDQIAYGIHWDHSRKHQGQFEGHHSDREENSAIASRHGGLHGYGRLRGMELGVEVCEKSKFCLLKRWDEECKLPKEDYGKK